MQCSLCSNPAVVVICWPHWQGMFCAEHREVVLERFEVPPVFMREIPGGGEEGGGMGKGVLKK